jgi:predicted enzyme related to lactoylglutathione lyase
MANLKNGFVFHELMTTDVEGAKNFYQKITGLTVTPGPYPMLMDNKQPVAGLVSPRADGSAWPSGGPESHWIAYFSVNDVDATARKAKQLGGKVLLPPTDVWSSSRPKGPARSSIRHIHPTEIIVT